MILSSITAFSGFPHVAHGAGFYFCRIKVDDPWAAGMGAVQGSGGVSLPLQTQVQRITDSEFISVASADPEQACVCPAGWNPAGQSSVV